MAKKLSKNTSIAKAKSLKTNVTRKFAAGGTGDPLKKGNIATAADSSFVADKSNEAHNFYINSGYKVEREQPIHSDIFKLLEEKRKDYKNEPTYNSVRGHTDDLIPYEEYTNYKAGQHRFGQKEFATGVMNRDAPMSYYDDRIVPQYMSGYFAGPTSPGGDYANVPTYNKLAVTPWGKLSKSEKLKRLEQFGGSGTPFEGQTKKEALKNYKNPMPQPKMKEAGLLPVPKIDLQPQLQNTTSPYSPVNNGYYYIEPSGNPGVGVIHYKKDNGDGTFTTRVIGPSLARDWYNDADQKIFDDKDSSTRVGNKVDYDPNDPDQKIYASMYDAVQGLEKNAPSIQNQSDKKVNGVRTSYAKFATGGPANFDLQNLIDPEKPVTPANPGANQFFPTYYNANKEAFDASDSTARTWGTDWFEKRKELPQFKDTSEVFLNTFKNSAPAYYFPDEAYNKTNYLGGKEASLATAATPALFDNIQKGNIQDAADDALTNNPYSSPKLEKGYMKTVNEAGEKDYLNTNSVYYKGLEGVRPYISYEELNHIGSGIAGQVPGNTHAAGMEVLANTITPDLINQMGYKDVDKNMGAYYADPEEYYTSLQTARKALNLDPTKNYTEDEMYNILEEGRAKGKSGLFNKENAEEGQMTRFYQAIGYPTTSSKFVNGKDIKDLTEEELQQYNQAKRDAVKRFLITHNAVAENKTNTEDYGLPQAARYGGYQKYVNGGPGKKKEPAKKSTNQVYPPGYFVTNPRIVYHTDPREFQIASGAEADSAFAHHDTQNFINYLKVNPQAKDPATGKLMGKLVSEKMLDEYTKKGVARGGPGEKRIYPKNSATGKDIKPVNVGLVWPSKTRGELYVQGNWNEGSYGTKAQDEFRKNAEQISAGYYTGYYPAPKEHHVLETAGEPMEPIGMKPIESTSAPVKIESQLPQESYTLHETGNGGGAAYLYKTVRDKNGNIIQNENMGIVLTEDFLTTEQQKEFDSKAGGTASVQFNPKAQIWHDLQEPLQIIEEKRGTKQKQLSMQQKAQQEIEAEKAAQQQWEIEQRAKEKARIKKAQEEIEAQKGQRALGGFGDPGKRTKELSTRTKTSDQNYVIKQDMYDEGDYNSVETKTRRSLKGFIKGAPKPEAPFTRKISAGYSKGGMNKNMLNANSTTGPRSEHSWQDPGVNRFSGNTNGVNADYYFKKGGLKSKVSSKFAKLKL